MNTQSNLKQFWHSHATKVVLGLILVVFLAASLFIALNLQPGIIPDEPAHFTFSKHFATTWGIPPDTYETYAWGWYIQQNPFLYYWINGRLINLVHFTAPAATDLQLLMVLRVVNVLFAAGTLLFCYLLSQELIRHPWWQLLPVFLLTHTLMFVFLAGGVNYDNLANLFSMAGLYFLARVFKRKRFIENSFAWLICIALGTLVKYTLLPLALVMTLTWLVYAFVHCKEILPLRLNQPNKILLAVLLVVLLAGNFAIYGVNLIRYQALTPPCQEILLESQCEISPYARRTQEMVTERKMTIQESVARGYPNPISYVMVDWVYNMLMRSFGMIGHQSYFPLHLISFYQLLFNWVFILSLINVLSQQRISFTSVSLIAIVLFYAVVLLVKNYNSELVYGFKQIAFQGRYIFPVIGAIYVLFTKTLKATPIRILKWVTLAFTLGLMIYGGPWTILRGYNSFLTGWFF